MPSEFERALDEVRNENRPVDRRLVAALSDPTRAETDAFAVCIAQLSAARRRELLAMMVESAEESFELEFSLLFRACLRDADAEVRRSAVYGLWEDERPGLLGELLTMLETDPDAQVRAAVAMALGRFVYMAEGDELEEGRAVWLRTALERVIDNPSEDVDVVRRAIESIAYINDERVRGYIDRAYEHGDSRMRESALFAMGRNADPVWTETVLTELHEGSPAMRYEAARASGEMQLRRAVGMLISMTREPDAELQVMAVWALGQIGGERAERLLERLADSDDEALRMAALDAIEEARLATRPMDMFVQDLDDIECIEEQFSSNGMDDEFMLDDDEDDDDGWDDDFIDID
ncbi:MAG TPA: HEAT repeat domain-containing protein [Chloroflexi bacterium]|jgi:HEAT repeat protein|nr:HEAT repeat domain-containing protein [Chloroflexota bacterium]